MTELRRFRRSQRRTAGRPSTRIRTVLAFRGMEPVDLLFVESLHPLLQTAQGDQQSTTDLLTIDAHDQQLQGRAPQSRFPGSHPRRLFQRLEGSVFRIRIDPSSPPILSMKGSNGKSSVNMTLYTEVNAHIPENQSRWVLESSFSFAAGIAL